MKAKKIISTDKEPKVIFEMSGCEAESLLSLLVRVRQSFEVHGFETGFYGDEYELAKSAEYFKSLLELQ